jgi:hypothetical protein
MTPTFASLATSIIVGGLPRLLALRLVIFVEEPVEEPVK